MQVYLQNSMSAEWAQSVTTIFCFMNWNQNIGLLKYFTFDFDFFT